ncbi:hypothetical protein Hamer_G023357, partial [Homarus americanus]
VRPSLTTMSLWCSSRWPSPLAADSRRDIIRAGLLLVCLPDLDAHTNLTSHRTILMGWSAGEGMIAVVRTINGSACSQRYEGRNVGISVSSLCQCHPAGLLQVSEMVELCSRLGPTEVTEHQLAPMWVPPVTLEAIGMYNMPFFGEGGI